MTKERDPDGVGWRSFFQDYNSFRHAVARHLPRGGRLGIASARTDRRGRRLKTREACHSERGKNIGIPHTKHRRIFLPQAKPHPLTWVAREIPSTVYSSVCFADRSFGLFVYRSPQHSSLLRMTDFATRSLWRGYDLLPCWMGARKRVLCHSLSVCSCHGIMLAHATCLS